jgi:hypothetical protein
MNGMAFLEAFGFPSVKEVCRGGQREDNILNMRWQKGKG